MTGEATAVRAQASKDQKPAGEGREGMAGPRPGTPGEKTEVMAGSRGQAGSTGKLHEEAPVTNPN